MLVALSFRSMDAHAAAGILSSWRRPGTPLADSLEHAVGDAILAGTIAVGARLPSERALASALGISRVSVSSAYGALRASGWIVTARGAGSRARLPEWLNGAIAPVAPGSADLIDLVTAAPRAPLPAYARALERAAEDLRAHALTAGATPPRGLQAAIADRYTRQGLPTLPSQVLVTSGAAAALLLVVHATLRQGARMVVESPTYAGALAVLRAAGLRLRGWPMLSGRRAGALADILRDSRATAAYLILDFHNPTGMVADADARERMVADAVRSGATLIVDETLRELDLRHHETTAWTPDPVIRLGSLSKSVWAGLRIGWVRASPELVATLRALPLAAAVAPPPLEQLVALRLLDELDDIVTARRRELRRRLVLLSEQIAAWPGGAFASVPAGGLSAWLRLAEGISSSELARHAPAAGLRVQPGTAFSPDGTLDEYLRIPLTLSGDELTIALNRLAGLLEPARARS
jgi:DNA-binding transcriptional MocR family regulator